jgi:ABC-2 type transport system permease protein
MRAFTALVRKDIRLYLADRRAVMMSVLAPIAIASFFGFIFDETGSQHQASRVAVLLADEDRSAISTNLASLLTADAALDVKAASAAGARDAVRRGKATVAIRFPAGFGTTAASAYFGGLDARKADIELLYDPSHATEASMVQGILAGHAMEAVSKEMFSGKTGRDAVDSSLARVREDKDIAPDQQRALTSLLEGVKGWNDVSQSSGSAEAVGAATGPTIPFEVKKEAVTSGTGVPYNGYAHSFAGMGVQFILFMAIEMGVGLLAQRREGLWKRLRAAPLSRTVLLGSRAVSTALLSLFILACLFLFARVVFGVRIEGSLIGFVGVAVAFSLLAAAFGLLIASLGKTPESARGLSIVATLLLVMLGGAWVPTFVFPKWLQQATAVVPTRWAVDGLDAATWRGLGLSSVAWPIVLLLAATLVFGGLAVGRFRWESE